MRRHLLLILFLILPVSLAGCGGPAKGTAPVNVNAVLERVAKTLVEFDAYLRRYDYREVDKAMYQQFNTTIQHSLNEEPRIHATKFATILGKDGSVVGYGDLNQNGRVDPNEPRLFKVELDTDNSRVIVTSAAYGNSTGRSMPGAGFFTGVMIGSLVNRQMASGVGPGFFNSRKVAGAPIGTKMASASAAGRGKSKVARRSPSARSSARSGGIRGGK